MNIRKIKGDEIVLIPITKANNKNIQKELFKQEIYWSCGDKTPKHYTEMKTLVIKGRTIYWSEYTAEYRKKNKYPQAIIIRPKVSLLGGDLF